MTEGERRRLRGAQGIIIVLSMGSELHKEESKSEEGRGGAGVRLLDSKKMLE